MFIKLTKTVAVIFICALSSGLVNHHLVSFLHLTAIMLHCSSYSAASIHFCSISNTTLLSFTTISSKPHSQTYITKNPSLKVFCSSLYISCSESVLILHVTIENSSHSLSHHRHLALLNSTHSLLETVRVRTNHLLE